MAPWQSADMSQVHVAPFSTILPFFVTQKLITDQYILFYKAKRGKVYQGWVMKWYIS